MKKISTAIALATLVTIGSVYASWHYTTGTVKNTFFLDGSTNVGITDKVGSEKGSLAINRDAFSIVIDDTDEIDHKADCIISGDIVLTYTPTNYDALHESEKENGLSLYFVLESNIKDYPTGENATPIFTLCDYAHAIDQGVKNVDESGKVTFTYTITAAQIDAAINFYTSVKPEMDDESTHVDGELYLLTEADYDAFKTALHDGALSITIGEASDFPNQTH